MKQFHAFRLDPVNHRLWRGDERVTMTPKAFLMRILRSGTEVAEKNGNDPWIFVFREAWLRTVVLDFDRARRLCDTIADTATAVHANVPLSILLTGLSTFRAVMTPEMPSQRTSPLALVEAECSRRRSEHEQYGHQLCHTTLLSLAPVDLTWQVTGEAYEKAGPET